MARRDGRTEISADEYRAAAYVGAAGEAAWQERVKTLAIERGWSVLLELPDDGLAAIAIVLRQRRMPGLLALLSAIRGWPDLTLAHPNGRTLFVEVKTDAGSVKPAQRDRLAQLRAAGQDANVWRPRDEARLIARLEGIG